MNKRRQGSILIGAIAHGPWFPGGDHGLAGDLESLVRLISGAVEIGELIMCLGVPGLVVAVDGMRAQVDFWGVRRQILVSTVDEPVEIGDYVLVHVGFAIRKIPAREVQSTLDFYESLLAVKDGDDLMMKDVQDEINAAT